jgi:hypothetical protein
MPIEPNFMFILLATVERALISSLRDKMNNKVDYEQVTDDFVAKI